METQELLLTALRAAAVYVLMLVVIRLMGKRTVGNFTVFDLLVALMLGEIADGRRPGRARSSTGSAWRDVSAGSQRSATFRWRATTTARP
jgi:hypothetical protein